MINLYIDESTNAHKPMSRRNYVYLASNIGEKKTFLRKKKVSKLQFIVTKDKVDFIFTM